ncbi:MAG: hypothetical protein WB508_11735 [Aeromicrobium sp.]|uniref:hypothetical protein n=1 Tax=Aeromicrobium sp. TaxID=1871063 RepID=UPI003C5CCA3D
MTTYDKDHLEAVQAVVDRVSSYQDGAPRNTIETELLHGFEEAGVNVPAEDVTRLAAAIDAENGDVSATDVLG